MYIAVDIETTGLDPEKHQILEIAMVVEQPSRRVVDCPFLHTFVRHEDIVGTPFALTMNAHAIKILAMNVDSNISTPEEAVEWIGDFVREYGQLGEVNLLGKNVASFDYPFLKRLPRFPASLFSHRMLDVGSLWATPNGMKSQEQLFKVYSDIVVDIPGEPHEALYDARVSLALARAKWGLIT